jgi:hypothetical protein
MKALLLMVFAISLGMANAQIREIPAEVKATFERQYAGATNVEYDDDLREVEVTFTLDGHRYKATYDNKGAWKETEQEWTREDLPHNVQDGFAKSKYAGEWEIKEVAKIFLPGGSERFRMKVEKNGLRKKYLFFNTEGRLVRDALTI